MENKHFFDTTQFNPQQRKIIEEPAGVHCIVAGAGTGKTRVLTSRIYYVIQKFNIKPNRILAITFTNKAAGEIANRINRLVPSLRFSWVNTFHTFCRKFLSEEIGILGRSNHFSIVDDEDQTNIIKIIYKENNFDRNILSYKAAVNIINIKKGFGVSIDDALNIFYNDINFTNDRLEKTRISRTGYQLYEDYMQKNNLVDFNDLLIFTHDILTKYPEVRQKWQDRFDYVFIDEFQDVNKIQYEIILFIAEKKRNIFVVGDSDQSIYAWRGANKNIETRFRKDFPEVKIMLLEQNYRSSKNILDIANDLIKNNKERIEKNLFTTNKTEKKVVYYNAYSQADEAEWVANQINQLVAVQKTFSYNDVTILYRSNYWSRAIEQALITLEIPYMIYGGVKFYQRKEIKDILAYIKTIIFKDDLSVLRIINVPPRKIGEKSLKIIQQFSNENGISIYDTLVNHQKIVGLTSTVHFAIGRFLKDLQTIVDKSELKFDRIVNTIVEVINYKDALDSNIKFRMENLDQLSQAMMNFAQNNPQGKIVDFLNEIALFTDLENDDERDKKNVVKLMTIHTAKGLEFPCVFVVGLVEGVFPTSHSISMNDLSENLDEIEEERRILYVAVTRAMKNLYLSSCGGYNFIKDQPMFASRFIKEINLLNLDTEFKKLQPIINNKRYVKNDDDIFDSKKNSVANTMYDFDVNIKEGEIIVHKVFGSGVVVKVDGQFIDVKFNDNIGIKTLLKNHRSIIRKLS